mgnify:CR=1 FL=1
MIIKKTLINEFLVIVMALILILSQTTLHSAQVLLELCLIIILALLLLQRKLKVWEISLFLFVLVTQLMSILVYESPLSSFMLNTKMTGLAFMSLIYFRNNATVSISMKVFFIICLILVLIQYFITSKFPVNIDQSLIKNLSIYNHKQPLGLFLDYHVSSYFLAIYFIGISLTRRLFFIDLIIIWIMGVRTSFLALIGQKFFTMLGSKFSIFSKASVQITIVSVGVILLLTILLPVFYTFLNVVGLGGGDSITIMSKLIITPNLYLDALSYIPMDFHEYKKIFTYDVGVKFSINELTLIAIMVIFGAPMGLFFLYFLFKFAPSYRVFILLSLLHYAAILNPFIIYLVFMFENKLIQLKEHS